MLLPRYETLLFDWGTPSTKRFPKAVACLPTLHLLESVREDSDIEVPFHVPGQSLCSLGRGDCNLETMFLSSE